MTTLFIKETSEDVPIINRAKKGLMKGIKLTSSNDLDRAVILANYLFAIKRHNEAANLLDSFIYQLHYNSERQDLWGSNGQGVILRAHIAGSLNELGIQSKLRDLIANNDIMTDRCGKYELFLEDLENHEYNMKYALSESQKYKCEIIGQEGLNFIYYFEMLFLYKGDVPHTFEQNLKGLINKCYSDLEIALLKK